MADECKSPAAGRTCLRRRFSGRAQLNRPQVAQNHWRLGGAQAGLAREPEHDEALGTWQWLRHQQQTQPGRGRAAAQQSRGSRGKAEQQGQQGKHEAERTAAGRQSEAGTAAAEQTVAAAWHLAGKDGTGAREAAQATGAAEAGAVAQNSSGDNDRQGQNFELLRMARGQG